MVRVVVLHSIGSSGLQIDVRRGLLELLVEQPANPSKTVVAQRYSDIVRSCSNLSIETSFPAIQDTR